MNQPPKFNQKQASKNISKIFNPKEELKKNPIIEELESIGVFG